jgi:hypothetical protein
MLEFFAARAETVTMNTLQRNREGDMKLPGWVLTTVLVMQCLLPAIDAVAADVQVYKGELRISTLDQQGGNTLSIIYRTKTREVLRIGIQGLVVTDIKTGKLTRLEDRSVSLADRVEDGYWNTEILYEGLHPADAGYRVQGRVTTYLVGSQQTRNFSVELKSQDSSRSHGSNIDWGKSK